MLCIICNYPDSKTHRVKVHLTKDILGITFNKTIVAEINLPHHHSQFSRILYNEVSKKYPTWRIVASEAAA